MADKKINLQDFEASQPDQLTLQIVHIVTAAEETHDQSLISLVSALFIIAIAMRLPPNTLSKITDDLNRLYAPAFKEAYEDTKKDT